MPRHCPTTNINLVGHLDLRPEKCVGEYLISKRATKTHLKPPKHEVANDSVGMLYVRNCHEYRTMLSAQRKMLSNTQRQGTVNMQRIKKMSRMQDQLRKRLISVSEFMKECADKKRQAQDAVEQETALHNELREGIKYMENGNQLLEVFRDDLQNTIRNFEPYKRIIEEVINKSHFYESTSDCIDRCHALMLAQVEIGKFASKKVDEIEGMRQSMIQITNDAELAIMGIQNDLARLERSYNKSRADCLRWEKILAKAKNTVTEDSLTKARAQDAIFPLYIMLCRRRNITQLYEQNDIPQIFDFINTEVIIMKEVLEEMEQEKDENRTEISDLSLNASKQC